MGIFGKLFEKKKGSLKKEDIYIYAESMDEPIVREDKNYAVAGYYNKDKSKFTNIVTGQVYKVDQSEDKEKVLTIDGKKMFCVGKDQRLFSNNFEEERWLGPKLDTNIGEFDWISSLKIGRGTWTEQDWVYFAHGLDKKGFMDLLLAKDSAVFSDKQLAGIVNIINNHAYKTAVNELDQLKDQVDSL